MPKIITVYLSGPMYLGKEQAMGWRNDVKRYIRDWEVFLPGLSPRPPATFNVIDPCDRWLDKGGPLENEGPFVVQMDKMEIAKSDVLIVNATNPGWGTPMEQFLGWQSGKLVIAFCECDYPSIWATIHSHKMCKTHMDAAKFLCEVAARQLARVV